MRCSTSGVACVPAMLLAGSPGTAKASRKVMMLTKKSTTTIQSSLRTTYLPIVSPARLAPCRRHRVTCRRASTSPGTAGSDGVVVVAADVLAVHPVPDGLVQDRGRGVGHDDVLHLHEHGDALRGIELAAGLGVELVDLGVLVEVRVGPALDGVRVQRADEVARVGEVLVPVGQADARVRLR